MHLAEHAESDSPWQIPVSDATFCAATGLAVFFLGHAEAAFALMGMDPVVSDARYLLKAIRHVGQDQVPKKDLWYRVKGRFTSKIEPFNEAIELLRQHGYIRKIAGQRDPKKKPQGRKPGPVYLINPLFLDPPPDSPDESDD